MLITRWSSWSRCITFGNTFLRQVKILDAGGGPGRYTLELCRAGYDVVLLDIDPTYTTFAEEKIKLEPKHVSDRLVASIVGDIRDLSRFNTDDFDAVLCLGGPLTHISDATERTQATSELVRVAKPGAIVCIAVVGISQCCGRFSVGSVMN